MKWRKLQCEIYPATIYFAQGGTPKELVNKLRALGLQPEQSMKFRDEELGFTMKMKTAEDTFAVLIWLKSVKKTAKEVSLVAHECLHATYFVFKYLSMKGGVSDRDQELHAYFLDYIIEKALECFWEV